MSVMMAVAVVMTAMMAMASVMVTMVVMVLASIDRLSDRPVDEKIRCRR